MNNELYLTIRNYFKGLGILTPDESDIMARELHHIVKQHLFRKVKTGIHEFIDGVVEK